MCVRACARVCVCVCVWFVCVRAYVCVYVVHFLEYIPDPIERFCPCIYLFIYLLTLCCFVRFFFFMVHTTDYCIYILYTVYYILLRMYIHIHTHSHFEQARNLSASANALVNWDHVSYCHRRVASMNSVQLHNSIVHLKCVTKSRIFNKQKFSHSDVSTY